MLLNLDGRVRNLTLPVSKPLLPMIEAVVNSLDAIRETGRVDGHVRILIKRGPGQKRTDGGEDPGPVVGFEISDNGSGFNDENLKSFETSDSDWKRARGGKGVGRMLWLKAFESAQVQSCFMKNGARTTRTFTFELPAGTSEVLEELTPDAELTTTVRLAGYKSEYSKGCPREAAEVARLLLEHLLPQLLDPNCPAITVSDDSESHSLNEMFHELLDGEAHRAKPSVKGHEVTVIILALKRTREARNRLHYCAHGREVKAEALSVHMPDLGDKISGESGSGVLACYIAGEVLDDNVSPERTSFTLNAEPLAAFPGEVSVQDLRNAAILVIRDHYGELLERLHAEKLVQIRTYVQQKAPRYGFILSAERSEIDQIPSGLSEDKLEEALNRVAHRIEDRTRRRTAEVLKQDPLVIDANEFHLRMQEIAKAITEQGRSKLADYVCHRRAVLDLLAKALERRDDGKYSLEEAVHELVYPLRATSDTTSYEEHNLWLVDERLAYHRFLASDVPLNAVSVLDVDTEDRPDIVIFGPALAMVDSDLPFTSVTILEFKRPMRPAYSKDENPIAQVQKYIRKIKAGHATTETGRPVIVRQDTPFYAYILLDLNDKIREYADLSNLNASPDGLGYYGYNTASGAYIEIVSYDKLVNDATKRNKAFFDRLQV